MAARSNRAHLAGTWLAPLWAVGLAGSRLFVPFEFLPVQFFIDSHEEHDEHRGAEGSRRRDEAWQFVAECQSLFFHHRPRKATESGSQLPSVYSATTYARPGSQKKGYQARA
jgi:hypothetical protein